jgi:hypothetical protein
MATLKERVWCFFGLHAWEYENEMIGGKSYWRYRRCPHCRRKQEFVAVPAAPMGFCGWFDVDNQI